jgi:hypothetical protein
MGHRDRLSASNATTAHTGDAGSIPAVGTMPVERLAVDREVI